MPATTQPLIAIEDGLATPGRYWAILTIGLGLTLAVLNGAIAIGGATAIGSDRSYYLPSYTVTTLPAAGTAGRMVFASNCRMFNGVGLQEGTGAGTGGLVTDNGTAWKIAGTNVTAIA